MDRYRSLQLLSLLVPVAVWQLAVGVFGVVSPAILPPPLVIAQNTVASLTDAAFLNHAAVTVRRTVVASAFASVFGTLLGLAMGWTPRLKAVLSPLAAAVFALPTIALLPLVILVLGSTERALVFTAALGAFFLVLWNAMNGARDVETVYLDVARDNGATSRYTLFREVLLPGALPLVLVGVRLGLSTSLLIVVAVEFIVGSAGLGHFLYVSWVAYRLPDVYTTLVVVGAFGIAITYGLAFVQYYLVPWRDTVRRTLVV
jgi:NitT/TauT family transport system permease protein